LRPFGIERYAVTNQRYARFVEATGYRTDAERLGWSYVFASLVQATASGAARQDMPWWQAVEGACWAHPEGPGSTVAERHAHPATHLSWNDAAAFAVWSGGRLPSEAEWEYAARGGRDARRFPWGDQEPTDTSSLCNIWQGRFPVQNTCVDGFAGTAPVNAYDPNPAGLYNCSGNVWEWCHEPFRVRLLSRDGRQRDAQATSERERVLKGGSYLCHRSYCYRYRIAARTGRAPDTSAGHTGMRVAYDGARAAGHTPEAP
jgi:formylglycine-generating enzyme